METERERGVDRLDDELILSAFHEDAEDFHGRTGRNPRECRDRGDISYRRPLDVPE